MIKKEIYPKTKRVSCAGDKVYITEKLDGSNLVFFKKDDELYIAQRKNIFKITELEDGKKVCNVTVAIPRSYKNENGEYDTDFVKCTMWSGVAENTSEYCKQGDLIGIKGRIQTRVIEKDNSKQTIQEVIAEKVTFLAKSKEKTDDEIEI